VELAQIRVQADIASSQALVVGEALKAAKIDIVGGDTQFFDRITGAISAGKAIDRLVNNSATLTEVKETFFNGDAEYFHTQVRSYIDRFGLTSDDVKNLSVAAALTQMVTLADDSKTKGLLNGLIGHAKRLGLDGSLLSSLPKNGGIHAGN
jgi:flotillin